LDEAFTATARPAIVFAGHAGIPTGFARVIASIVAELPRRYRVTHAHIDSTPDEIAASRPDLVVIVDEPWRCAAFAAMLDERGARPRTIAYIAIDGEESMNAEIAARLARIDCVVTFQQFGRAIAERHFASIGAWPARLATIPHGVDTRLFHPIDRRAARGAVFGTAAHDDDFIVLNANRNQPFKRIDLTMEAFALFARDKPSNVKLCLHMGTRVAAPGEIALADRFGIRERLLLTEHSERHPNVSDQRLNAIYNACDIGLNTSEKEGWGLIAFEHGATRAAQIVPRHTACAELWEGGALLVEPAQESSAERYMKAGRSVPIEGVAAALETLYRDEEIRERLAGAAFARAHEARYAWSNIAQQWDALFRECLA
jgi:glycosyltransferase involved in cell wall biosynthesis